MVGVHSFDWQFLLCLAEGLQSLHRRHRVRPNFNDLLLRQDGVLLFSERSGDLDGDLQGRRGKIQNAPTGKSRSGR